MPETQKDRTDGLLHLFQTAPLSITAAFEDDDNDYYGHDFRAPHDEEPCPSCGEDHGPRDCPYGGCYDGEHCPNDCPYESGHTDWDHVYPHLPDTMHRGMSLRLSHHPDWDPAAPPHHMARTIAENLREYGSGTHWTPNEHMARHYAAVSHRHHDDLHVILHAAKPHRDDIEEDPHELLKHDVIGFGEHADAEIPLQQGVHLKLTGISYRRPDEQSWTRHDFKQPMEHRAQLEHTAGAAERERFAPRDGEFTDWGPGKDRIMRGLSRGELHIEDARQIGYGRNGMEGMDEDRRDGWQTMPRDLWHTTTNVGEAIHGLKTRDEMDMRHGHGLGGGASDTISLTDSRHHAHVMLAGLREYHDVLTGKTPLHELAQRAATGADAKKPYGDYFRGMIGHNDHNLSSMMRGMRHEPGLRTPEQAAAEGLTPHPENHHKATIGDMAGGWERPATPSELSNDRSEIYKAYGSARWHGGQGRRPILFMSNDPHALAQKKRSDFAVLHVRSRPGAQGYRIRGEHEWRTGSGDAVQVMGVDEHPDVDHDWQQHTAGGKPWLPHDRYFGPGQPDLDPRLFDSTHLKPAWRRALLGLVNRAFADYTYRIPGGWQRWAHAYLAGSQASHWYGNNDLDVLVGIDYEAFRRAQPRYRTMSDRDIDEMLNARAHEVCDPARWFTIDGKHLGPFDSTVYVNPDSFDIRKIKPYAAYDLNDGRWAVEPVEVPEDFGPDKLPSADFLYARSLASQVRALRKLPAGQAQALGAALYDKLHGERHDAFSDHGGGLYDARNVAWKYLALHPEKPMERLVAWKRAEQAEPGASHAAILRNPRNRDASNEDDPDAKETWYHGTGAQFDRPEAHHEEGEWRHWNTNLGSHWSSSHALAGRFALAGGKGARVLHGRLDIRNPRRYKSEYDMDREVYSHEYDEGNRPESGYDPDLRHEEHQDRPDRFAAWLSNHPDREGISARFKQRLQDAGHDGIVYGNEVEQLNPRKALIKCAIAFHPDQVQVTQHHPPLSGCAKTSAHEVGHTAGMNGPASDATFEKSSVMIALVPPRDLAERLVLPDGKGEPVDQLHVTLAYIPHVEPAMLGRLTGTVAEWASRQKPIVARVQGAGTFVNVGKHPLWAAVDIPGSSHLHSSLVDALRKARFEPSQEHGFTPHMTLSYEKYHVRFIPKITPESFTCHSVYVCQGDNWRPVPVGGSTGGKVG